MTNVKLHTGIALIEVKDPVLLAEIENDPFLSRFIGEALSETCLVVQPQAIPEVVERLRVLGHMPRVVEGTRDLIEE